jgi:hypothetical protein
VGGYCAASDVGILTQNILGGEPTYSTSTSPNIAAVNSWVTTGCAVIDTHLGGAGYAIPVASGTAAFGMLTRCNALFAAARVEESRTNITLGPGERTRGVIFDEHFQRCIESLLKMDLTLAGLTRTSTAEIFAGGIKVVDKQTTEADSTLVKPRFTRDQFDFPGTLQPGNTTASGN